MKVLLKIGIAAVVLWVLNLAGCFTKIDNPHVFRWFLIVTAGVIVFFWLINQYKGGWGDGC